MLPSIRQRPLLQKAQDVRGLPFAFRPGPLRAEELAQFYSDALDKNRANKVRSRLRDDLVDNAKIGYLFKGVIYGNRGTGKSTEINRLLEEPAIKQRFLVVRVDALDELNPQTFGAADVLLLICVKLIETCRAHCEQSGEAFHECFTILGDLHKRVAPWFPALQDREQVTTIHGASGELNILQLLKASVRVEGQRKMDLAQRRETLSGLTESISIVAQVVQQRLPDLEILLIGENFDKEQIPPVLLDETFVQYATVLRDIPIHMLFTLPVPFVYAKGQSLVFAREYRYPVYDVPLFDSNHKREPKGVAALQELLQLRADVDAIFDPGALDLLLFASGGDLYLLFAMITTSGRLAQYRAEDIPGSPPLVLTEDAATVVREQLGVFRNELGTSSTDSTDKTTWEAKRDRLRRVYESDPAAIVPDDVLYQLLRRRAILFCNGRGRYALHPFAVEILREQFRNDSSFVYRGGGLDQLPPPPA